MSDLIPSTHDIMTSAIFASKLYHCSDYSVGGWPQFSPSLIQMGGSHYSWHDSQGYLDADVLECAALGLVSLTLLFIILSSSSMDWYTVV